LERSSARLCAGAHIRASIRLGSGRSCQLRAPGGARQPGLEALPEARVAIPNRGRAAQPQDEQEGEDQPRHSNDRDYALSVAATHVVD
jgi:hypothetical protein